MYYKGIVAENTIIKVKPLNEKKLFFKPQGNGDYVSSVLLPRAWSMLIHVRP